MLSEVSGAKSGMMYHASNSEDPYISGGGGADGAAAMEGSEEEEDEDNAIKASDMLLVTTRCEEVRRPNFSPRPFCSSFCTSKSALLFLLPRSFGQSSVLSKHKKSTCGPVFFS